MLREKYELFTNKDGEAVENDTVLRFLASTEEETAIRGASVRRADAVSAAGKLQLQLQSLPSPARFLNSAQFNGDNSVSVLLGAYNLHADLVRSEAQCRYSSLRTETVPRRWGSCATYEGTSRGVNCVKAKLLLMEQMPLFEAVRWYLQGKKLRPASQRFPFLNRRQSEPAPHQALPRQVGQMSYISSD